MKKEVSLKITLEQLVDMLEQLTQEELEHIELMMMKDEIKKRSSEVKKGNYLKLEELRSLKDV